jgi:hypothetical protein
VARAPGPRRQLRRRGGALAFPGQWLKPRRARRCRSPTWAAAPSPRSRSSPRCTKAKGAISTCRSSRRLLLGGDAPRPRPGGRLRARTSSR